MWRAALRVVGLAVEALVAALWWLVLFALDWTSPGDRRGTAQERRRRRRKRVVVVGASFAGLAVARELYRDFHVTLIDRRNFFEFTPGILYCLVHPSHAPSVLLPLSATFPSPPRFLASLLPPPPTILANTTLERLDKRTCHTSKGAVAFDFCVLAVGSAYRRPVKPDQACCDMHERVKQLGAVALVNARASSFVVVGGGVVAVELAAELVHEFPLRRVSLVSLSTELLPGTPRTAQCAAERWLRRRGVTVILGDTVERASPPDILHRTRLCETGKVFTSKGVELPASVVYWCAGAQPEGQFLEGSGAGLSAHLQRGAIVVNDALQVGGTHNIFAVGDVMHRSREDNKTAHSAELAAHAAALNIRRLARGDPPAAYPRSVVGAGVAPQVMCVSLGPRDGIVIFNGLVVHGAVGGKLAAVAKSVVEVTKMMQVSGNVLGRAVWWFGDAASAVLNRTLLPPVEVR